MESKNTRKPLAIIVSGAPGSGKTTLAKNLAEHMRLPHLPRDDILRGIETTKGSEIDRGGLGIEVYFSLLEKFIEQSVSFITDGTMYKGLSDKDIKKRLLPKAEIVNVHVRAKNELQRFREREVKRTGWSDKWVEGHVRHLNNIYHKAVEPLDLGVPVIEVDATDGYEPSLQAVIRELRGLYKDTRENIVEPDA